MGVDVRESPQESECLSPVTCKGGYLNIGTIREACLEDVGGVGAAGRELSTSCRIEEPKTGLKAAASGLKDVVRCCSAEIGRSMLWMLLLRNC